MAPRTGPRVRIVSPNSGNVTLSRSASLHSSNSRHNININTNNSISSIINTNTRNGNYSANSSACSSVNRGGYGGSRQPLQILDSNRTSSTSNSDSGNPFGKGSSRGADREAIQRAQEVLEAAGQCVLKKPFGGLTGANTTATTATATAAATTATTTKGSSSNSNTAANVAATKGALQLPQSIIGLYRGARSASVASSGGGRKRSRRQSNSANSSVVSSRAGSSSGTALARHEQQQGQQQQYGFLTRGRPTAATTNASSNTSRNGFASYTPASLGAAVANNSNGQYGANEVTALSRPSPMPRVCQPMFAGLSAIPLSERLFEGGDSRPADYYPSANSNGLTNSREAVAVAAQSGGSSANCPRRCARPLWSLVGTFKTALTSVVNVDYANDCLNWQQRNPKGGFQRIRVPLHAVLDAVTARVTQEDEDITERQFTVIVRTSARPSQMVFGFRSTREANEFRAMVVRPLGGGGGGGML